MLLRKFGRFGAVFGVAAMVAACGSDDGSVKSREEAPTALVSYFPLAGQLPTPNDLAFAGSEDGTVNAPVDDPSDFGDPTVAINALDGYSTVAPLGFGFTAPVEGETLDANTVQVLRLTRDENGNVTDAAPLTPGEDYQVGLSPADPNGTQAAVTPLAPLDSATTYLIAVLRGVEERGGGAIGATEFYRLAQRDAPLVDGDGNSQVAGLDDSEAATMEGVRQQVNPHLEVLAGAGIESEQVIASWTVTTQSIGDVLQAVRQSIQDDDAPQFVNAEGSPGLTSTNVPTVPTGAATLYAGALAGLPYYLEPAIDDNPQAVLTGFWQGADGANLTAANPTPQPNTTVTVPVLASIPTGGAPEGGWPVVIFQHGITADRTALLGIADSLAQANFAAVAIDLPLHGLNGEEAAPLAALRQPELERTFDVDLLDNETGAEGPDGRIDESGAHFINLSSLLTGRDNLRQAVSDLMAMTEALQAYSASEPELNTSNIRYLGHSLGGIVGGVFLANEPTVGAAVLGMPGGGIAKLLDGSATFGPQISARLAERGLVKGTQPYESFLAATQAVIDSGDPINYTEGAVEDRGVMLIEVVGGAGNPPDQVVPINVVPPLPQGTQPETVPSPTAGTDPLARVMGLTQVAGPVSGGEPLRVLMRYNAGDHISLLLPDPNPAVTAEMQSQSAAFLQSSGTVVNAENTSVLVPAPGG